MESSKHNIAYISLAICSNKLRFCEWTIFILFFQFPIIPLNLIISFLNLFIFLTSLLYRFVISFIRLIPLLLSLTASLFATTSCKNVETLQRKTGFFGFKSLLVTILCNIILASLLLSIQNCSSSFEYGLVLLATSTRGGHKYKIIDRPFKPKYGTVSQVLLQLVVALM